MVGRRKDSSSEIYVGLICKVVIETTSIITLVLLPQLVLYMAQQYRHWMGSREMETLYRGVELLSRNQTSAFSGREKRTLATRMSYGEALLSLRLTTQAGVKESMMPGTFCLFAQKGRTLRPPVYWPCIISVHQESCLQRWTLLRTVLWMGNIKGIIRVRWVEASMLHLTVSIKGITKVNPPLLQPRPQGFSLKSLSLNQRVSLWYGWDLRWIELGCVRRHTSQEMK